MEKEKKIFGQDASYVAQLTEAYCKRPVVCAPSIPSRSANTVWNSLDIGTTKLVEKRTDLLELI